MTMQQKTLKEAKEGSEPLPRAQSLAFFPAACSLPSQGYTQSYVAPLVTVPQPAGAWLHGVYSSISLLWYL